MAVAALILSVIALIVSLACGTLLLAQYFSTHKIEILDPKEMHKSLQALEKEDSKLNEKVNEIETEMDEWL